MEFTLVIAQVGEILSWLAPTVSLIALLRSPWAKGHIDEPLACFIAHQEQDEPTCRRLRNVKLSTPDYSSQIDYLFLSFMLESKYMIGWITTSGFTAQPSEFSKYIEVILLADSARLANDECRDRRDIS